MVVLMCAKFENLRITANKRQHFLFSFSFLISFPISLGNTLKDYEIVSL